MAQGPLLHQHVFQELQGQVASQVHRLPPSRTRLAPLPRSVCLDPPPPPKSSPGRRPPHRPGTAFARTSRGDVCACVCRGVLGSCIHLGRIKKTSSGVGGRCYSARSPARPWRPGSHAPAPQPEPPRPSGSTSPGIPDAVSPLPVSARRPAAPAVVWSPLRPVGPLPSAAGGTAPPRESRAPDPGLAAAAARSRGRRERGEPGVAPRGARIGLPERAGRGLAAGGGSRCTAAPSRRAGSERRPLCRNAAPRRPAARGPAARPLKAAGGPARRGPAPGERAGRRPEDAGAAGARAGGGRRQRQRQRRQQTRSPGAQEAARPAAPAPRRSLTGPRRRRLAPLARARRPLPAVPSPAPLTPPAARLSGGGAWGQGADLHAAAAAAACAEPAAAGARARARPARPHASGAALGGAKVKTGS